MDWLDSLLNCVALALWLGWRGWGVGRSLRLPRWSARRRAACAIALLFLLTLRPWAYWRWGVIRGDVPVLNLGVTAVPWNSRMFYRMAIFSSASFLVWWGALLAGFNVLSIASRPLRERNPWAAWAAAQLGWFGRWPTVLKVLLPWAAWGALWTPARPWLVAMHVALPVSDPDRLWEQAAVLGAMTIVVWPFFLLPVLLLGLLKQFVFLGDGIGMEFVDAVCRWATRPFRWLPLEIGRVDLSPAVGMVCWGAGGWFALLGLARLFQQLQP